jgi:tetratricopeptide (TPR) repeat protein
MQPAALHPLTSVEAEVRSIRERLERQQFTAALTAAEALAVRVPANRDVLYMIAVAQRNLKKIPEALASLDRLELHHPTFSRLFQERGHCQVLLRDAPRAIDAYLRAVNLNPALPASWQALKTLYRMTNDAANAEIAAAHVATLSHLPPEIIAATGLFSDGELLPAENIVRAYLLKHGNHVEGMRLLARIGLERDVLDDAELLLEAIQELEKLLQLEPRNRAFRITYATAMVGLGEHERALELYRELLVDAPRAAEIHLSIAHSLKTLGRSAQAIEAYRAAAEVRPQYGDAWWSLANLKTYRFTDDEVARMRAQEAAVSTSLVDRYHLCFALGKALEDRGEFAESFTFYERGNALKKSESRYRPEPVERNTRMQKTVCTHEFFAARQGLGAQDPAPIFIVGLPRSGSTLLEQVLASHSQVEGTMELADIPRIVQELQGPGADSESLRYPGVLAELKPQDFLKLGEKYLSDTRIYRSGKPFFIDKMPNNFRHIGLIHLMLPHAKIIDARRNPMACCFSNFKQLFASGQEFTYSLEDIGRYYRTYLELMAHWDAVLPGRVLRVEYEAVVEDLEGNVRRILDYCGLDFEPQCVQFHKTERSIRTASSEQVRQPINREGLDQWRHFAPWLGPLQAALAESPATPTS